jgi:hypothetical protein
VARKGTIADADRDLRAMDLARQGLTDTQIAAEMGYADRSGAFRARQRGIRNAFREEVPEMVVMEAERLNALRRLFEEIAASRTPLVSLHSGKVVMDPSDGVTPMVDNALRMQAGLALLRVSERWCRMKGLDAPSKRRVETIAEDTVDAEIKKLLGEAEIKAEAEARDAARSPNSD